MLKIADMEVQLKALQQERDSLAHAREQVDEEVNTLRRVVQQHQQESRNRESMLETKILELETLTKNRYLGVLTHFLYSNLFLR